MSIMRTPRKPYTFDVAARAQAQAQHYMLNGQFGLALVAFEKAIEHCLTDEGRAVLEERRQVCSQQIHAKVKREHPWLMK